MINLSRLKTCSSILDHNYSNLQGELNFYNDTRKFNMPGAFVAIPGNKVNPLNVISDLLEKGCPLVIYQRDAANEELVKKLKEIYPKTTFTPVIDSVVFLQELTHFHIVDWKKISPNKTVFAISGSNGKTTHKEMLSHILKTIRPGKVVATEKNNNNHLGVPLTLLNVDEQTDFVVLELGSNHPGEIKVLCDIAQPNSGITTNIGATHLEFFGTEEKVFDEEAHLYQAVKEVTAGEGFYLINLDDKYLGRLTPTNGCITFGENTKAEAIIHFLDHGAEINYLQKKIVVKNTHITGRHNKLNLITCAFIAAHFYPEHLEAIEKAAADFRPTKNRSEWIHFENKSVFLDAYNANPSSMIAALQAFKESASQQGFKLSETCVVLGDMNELGDNAALYHKQVGEYINELGFPNVYFVGRYADYYLEGFPGGNKRSSSAVFKPEYRSDCIKKFSIHFIKGSRSLQLESLFDIT
jgi:UDP-N-acetylmuramoyl-tripeptide--D-alanyl-D-alanine ligase